MDKNKIKRDFSKHKKLQIGLRISPAMSEFLRQNQYSPSKIFYEALYELGYKEDVTDNIKLKREKKE